MTPKEKAKELFKAMFQRIFDIDNGVNVMQDKTRYDAAKQCALISVDEIINSHKNCLVSKDISLKYDDFFEYYKEVKTELQNLQP